MENDSTEQRFSLFGKRPKETGNETTYKVSLEVVEHDIHKCGPAVLEAYKAVVLLFHGKQTAEVNNAAIVIEKQIDNMCSALGFRIKKDEDGVLRLYDRSGEVVAEDIKPKEINEGDR
jgi:hypothetical protein